MHEASIVESLLEAASSLAAGRTVLEIRATVGRLTGVSPDAMAFYFEALAPERLGSQARLTVRLEPLRARCEACRGTFELDDVAWLCPACGATALSFENGDELQLESLEIDDGTPDHDRAEDPQEER